MTSTSFGQSKDLVRLTHPTKPVPTSGVIDLAPLKITPADVTKELSPMGLVSTVNEIADAVLCLTEARSVTGQVLHVDSGAHRGKW